MFLSKISSFIAGNFTQKHSSTGDVQQYFTYVSDLDSNQHVLRPLMVFAFEVVSDQEQYPSLEITVGHHLWKSVFEYNFQFYSWKLYSKTLFHRWCSTVISRLEYLSFFIYLGFFVVVKNKIFKIARYLPIIGPKVGKTIT